MTPSRKFEETTIYKTHQHAIVFVLHTLKWSLLIGFPVAIVLFVLFDWMYAIAGFGLCVFLIAAYEHFLHARSWLLIGNQSITLFVRNGIFSQYTMSIRYNNIQDCACSKNSMLGYWLKYGTFFARSVSGKDGEHFQANYVPKVGKVYSIVNALAQLSDEERNGIQNLDQLFAAHKKEESDEAIELVDPVAEGQRRLLASIPGVVEVVILNQADRDYIRKHEARENEGILKVIESGTVFALTHDSSFREPDGPITIQKEDGTTYFPPVPFHELGPSAVSGSPGMRIHAYLVPKFREITIEYATVLVGV